MPLSEDRYPVGTHELQATYTQPEREAFLEELAALPGLLRAAVAGLGDAQLDTPYREGGWTVRQVVHHVADSHLNAYTRVRLALTEERPIIKPYDEQAWAELPDTRLPVEVSLVLLAALHERWTALFRGLSAGTWTRGFIHPANVRPGEPDSGLVSVEQALASYAWHGRHHLAHVTRLRERMEW